jgi:hypothetical protein
MSRDFWTSVYSLKHSSRAPDEGAEALSNINSNSWSYFACGVNSTTACSSIHTACKIKFSKNFKIWKSNEIWHNMHNWRTIRAALEVFKSSKNILYMNAKLPYPNTTKIYMFRRQSNKNCHWHRMHEFAFECRANRNRESGA